MPEEAIKPALRAALRCNEIGSSSPYQLSFAAKARSGASFGFMQGDMAAGQPVVLSTFRQAMAAAGVPGPAIDSLQRRLSVHLNGNPLSPAEREQVNAALLASAALVDQMDEVILAGVYAGVDTCLSQAHAADRAIAAEGQLYFALWINMTGAPSKVLDWLNGRDPHLARPIPAAGAVVSGAAARVYLAATDYFVSNPRNLPHLDESVAAGMRELPAGADAPLVMLSEDDDAV